MMTLRNTAILLLAAVVLAGCPSRQQVQEDPDAERAAQQAAEERAAAERERARAEAERVREQERLRANPLDDPDSVLAQRVIYFDFDRADVKPEFMAVIQAHAQYLAERPNARITLEGHTDERGSREYNIGLGNRRAQAVRRMLMFHGVADGQIATVSYGEEKPAARGESEQAWSRNRRVEIVYAR
ncbi:MAG: peptidoglycan-associated lipoprotein Pal [Gammaproteobacteria bacterium]